MTAATRPLRVWLCVRCGVPRSLGNGPCPNCRTQGVTETGGRWLYPAGGGTHERRLVLDDIPQLIEGGGGRSVDATLGARVVAGR